ncbi:MAG: biotin/lipoyl-binding protein, partial [Muribaculaceae bacterium]|nr:biotin/lipoyl-binding protein [Muribaculaceae bacterium]
SNRIWKWVNLLIVIVIMYSCGVDIPKEKQSSFETMTVKKSDIEVPMKFSAKMKGQADVTIMPQVSGQLMKIYVTEGQQVRKGQTLFAIDSRNAQHELESARLCLNRSPTVVTARHRAAGTRFRSAMLQLSTPDWRCMPRHGFPSSTVSRTKTFSSTAVSSRPVHSLSRPTDVGWPMSPL